MVSKKKRPCKIPDVVLVQEDGLPIDRKMAVIEKLIISEDGKVRAAEIKTANGRTNRPISKLYPLEVTDESRAENLVPEAVQIGDTSSGVTRKAAIEAKEKIRRVIMVGELVVMV